MHIEVGSYDIQYSGSLLTFHGRGPWNMAAVHRYKQDMKSAVTYFAGKKWGSLCYLAGEALLPPDAESYLREVSALHVAQGMQACAIILADTNYPAIVRSQAERVYTHAGVTNVFFDNDQKALTWINQQGYFQK